MIQNGRAEENRMWAAAGVCAENGNAKMKRPETEDDGMAAEVVWNDAHVSGANPDKERIVRYWTLRSDGFARQREAELKSGLHERWLRLIEEELGEMLRTGTDGLLKPGTDRRSNYGGAGGSKSAEGEAAKPGMKDDLHHEAVGVLKPGVDGILKEGGTRSLRILDVGTGSGFFAILLAQAGHRVTGIDLTESMVRHAAELAQVNGCGGEEELASWKSSAGSGETEGVNRVCTAAGKAGGAAGKVRGRAEFRVMDAEQLDFPSESFDVVISRNLTWTLPDAARAYREWMRVLKKGGVLLNYDADYGAACFTQEEELPKEHAHNKLGHSMMQECQSIKDGLSISTKRRPEWDVSVLRALGYEKIEVRRDISPYIYREKDEFYNPVPLFSLKVTKA